MKAGTRTSWDQRGFTLIELLVVIMIIGILSAIAIPSFLSQRKKAWRSAMQSDLRNDAVKMEEFFDETGSYAGATPSIAGFKSSDEVTVSVTGTPGVRGYCLKAVHSKLTTAYFLDSEVGTPGPIDCTAVAYG